MKALALAALLACAACRTMPPPLHEAIADASARGKPLVVEFYATWCKPCRMFEERVLPDARVQRALEDVHFIRYDVDVPSGREAFARCGGESLPLVVAIDRRGFVRLLKRGESGDAGDFLEFLRETHAVLGAP